MKLNQLFCKHSWKLLSWCEQKAYITDIERKCEFYFKCEKCEYRKNIKSIVDFSLIKSHIRRI